MKIYTYDMVCRKGGEILGDLSINFEINNMAEPDRTTAMNFLRSAMEYEPMEEYDIVWQLYEVEAEPKYEDYDANCLSDYSLKGERRLLYEITIKSCDFCNK